MPAQKPETEKTVHRHMHCAILPPDDLLTPIGFTYCTGEEIVLVVRCYPALFDLRLADPNVGEVKL